MTTTAISLPTTATPRYKQTTATPHYKQTRAITLPTPSHLVHRLPNPYPRRQHFGDFPGHELCGQKVVLTRHVTRHQRGVPAHVLAHGALQLGELGRVQEKLGDKV